MNFKIEIVPENINFRLSIADTTLIKYTTDDVLVLKDGSQIITK